MSRNLKIIGALSITEIFIVLASGFMEKGTENFYSGTSEYRVISYAFVALAAGFLLNLALIIWLTIIEAKNHPRKKYYPLIAAFALAILASVVWLAFYTLSGCGCGGA